MAKDQKGFIIYGDNEPLFDRLTDEEAGQLLKAMVKYFNNGTEPGFNDKLDMAWVTVKLQMDRNAEKYKKKCEKNRESIQNYWDKVKENTNEYERIRTYTNATNRDRDRDRNRDKNRDRDTESVPDVSSLSLSLIKHLNDRTGSVYEVDEATIGRVQTLLDSGYTQDQMRTVIDKKCSEWMKDEKMRAYLRPSTLFGDKFGEYLAAPISLAAERQQKADEDRAALERTLTEKRQTLSVLKESLSGADKTERRTLREQIAILEDSIGLIEKRIGGVV